VEGEGTHHSSGFNFDQPGRKDSWGPYIRPFKMFVGDITYQLRYLRHDSLAKQPGRQVDELIFLNFTTSDVRQQFTHIPYESDAFCWAARECSSRLLGEDSRRVTVFVAIVQGEPQSIDIASLREPDFFTMAGPVWCPVANMTEERRYGPDGSEIKRGSKHFAAGAKVYCFPMQWGDGYEQIEVVGRHRVTHRYVKMIISSSWLENWRVQLVYSPTVVRMLWPVWDGSERSRAKAQKLVDMINASLAQKRT
jgi:hypothetical protein